MTITTDGALKRPPTVPMLTRKLTQHRLTSTPVRRSLRMTVRAEDTKVLETMVVVDPVDVINLKCKRETIPFRPLTANNAFVWTPSREKIPALHTIEDIQAISNEDLIVRETPVACVSVRKIKLDAVMGACGCEHVNSTRAVVHAQRHDRLTNRLAVSDSARYCFSILKDSVTNHVFTLSMNRRRNAHFERYGPGVTR